MKEINWPTTYVCRICKEEQPFIHGVDSNGFEIPNIFWRRHDSRMDKTKGFCTKCMLKHYGGF